MGSFAYTPHPCFIFQWGVSLTHPMLASIFIWRVSLPHPVLALFLSVDFLLHKPREAFFSFFFFFLSGEFLLHIPCWIHFYLESFSYTSGAFFFFFFFFFFYLGSFSYTSHADFIFIWGVSLTHPTLALFFCGEFLLHVPCWLFFFFLFSFSNLVRFSSTSHAGFIFLWGVSLTPALASFLCGEFLLHIPCWLLFLSGDVLLHTARWLFFFLFLFSSFFPHLGVSLTHPVLDSFLSGVFLIHIRCFFMLFLFYLGSFSYTSHAAIFFIWGVSLTHPTLYVSVGSFSYTSHADFFLFFF